MSLQNLAQQVQSRGRGDDSVLVHMTPHEVGGLQALALAHGGSLTVNPETGLPEAGFLSSILPMVAGALLAPMTAGTSLAFLAANPLSTALTVGGLTGLATGSLNKGLMAGLGAYGGAGLAGGLSQVGANAPVSSAPTLATETGAALEGFKKTPSLFGGGDPRGIEALSGFGGGLPSFDPSKTPTFAAPLAAAPTVASAAIPTVAPPVIQNASFSPVTATGTYQPQPLTALDKLGAGVKRATSGAEGFKEFLAASEQAAPYSGLASLASLANAATPEFKPPKQSKALIRPYKFKRAYEPMGYSDTGYGTSERRYFDDQFTALEPYEAPGPEYAAGGGLMGAVGFASGGSPESLQDTGPYKYEYDPATGRYIQQAGPGMSVAPKLSTSPQSYSAATLNPVYQQYFGRDVDPAGIAAYTARQFSPAELDTILKASPEYAARQQQLAAAKKEASYATPTQVANMYRDLLNRPPDLEGLGYYTEQNRMSPADLKKTLMESTEYLTKLTKPLAPKPYMTQAGDVALEGAIRYPSQEAARRPDTSSFYAMMNQRLQEQAQRQPQYAVGGPVEQMSAANAVGDNLMYPQAQYQTPMYSNPMMQRPMPANVITQGLDAPVDQYTGEQRLADGGIANLGGYSDGGRLLKGPGDGVSDSIPAVIGQRQPARLADGEFVIPARIVSELGNGSTEAGARKLYAMMDRVQKARKKSVGKNRVAVNTKADKHLPA